MCLLVVCHLVLQFCVRSYKIDKDFSILYDSGIGKSWKSVLTSLVEILPKDKIERKGRKVCCVTVDAVVLSHPDKDHYGGFKRLLEKKKIKADDLYLVVSQFCHHFPEFLVDLVTEHGYKEIKGSDGHLSLNGEARRERNPVRGNDHYKLELVRDKVSLIYRRDGPKNNKNENSILLQVMNPKILLSGDSTGPVIWKHINPDPISVLDLFHVPHHGSRENSLAPIYAIRSSVFRWARLIAAKMLKEDTALYKAVSHMKDKELSGKEVTSQEKAKELSDKEAASHGKADKLSEEELNTQMKLRDVQFPSRYSPFDVFDEGLAKQLPSKMELRPAVVESIYTTLKIATFYRHARTKKYYISCSDHIGYKHPHMELICGIIIARVSQGRKCHIVLKSLGTKLDKKLKLAAFVLRGYDLKNFVLIQFLTTTQFIRLL